MIGEQRLAEILKQVQRIQIVANRSANDLLAGQYHSVFRGRGMEFDEVREYQPGDDIRTIDWNVTARSGTPFIKRFCEERELTVLFVVDVSASGVFGSGDRAKLEMIVEVAALLMFSALKNNDKVGLLTFCDQPLDFHPPRKGKANVLRLIRELLAVQPLARPTHLDSALQFLNRVQKRRAVVFLMSDFLMELPKDALAITNNRHELIAISVTDPREHALPKLGILTLEDPETGERVRIDTRSRRVRDQFARWASEREAKKSTTFKRLGIDELSLRTHPDTPASAAASELIMPQYVAQLRRFLVARQVRTGR
jgi:uncharacterized protein (DUF58 family)